LQADDVENSLPEDEDVSAASLEADVKYVS
jgi:hypothetical protein